MFRKKKTKEPGYEVKNLGALIIERTQMPHSLTEEDGSYYKVLTWIIELRVDNGPVLMERRYVIGKREDIDKLQPFMRPWVEVQSDFQAEHLFYRDLYNAWRLQ